MYKVFKCTIVLLAMSFYLAPEVFVVNLFVKEILKNCVFSFDVRWK